MSKKQITQAHWQKCPSSQFKSQNAVYKIIPDKFLGRGGFGIVYQGYRKQRISNIYMYDIVAIKEFKKSDKWVVDEDRDKEISILSQYSSILDKKYVLEIYQIFKCKEHSKFYMISKLCSEGTLTDKIKTNLKEDNFYDFSLRMAQILNYIHYQALKDYCTKQKGQDLSLKIGIMHRDVKPPNIVYSGNDEKSIYLLDFGIAKIVYSDYPKSYNNCGTSNYKAPQINQGKNYNCKVDIYGFGCTLYEMITGGQKLISANGLATRFTDRQIYVQVKLKQLLWKMKKNQSKFKKPHYWLQILQKCLMRDFNSRWSSKQLLDFLIKQPWYKIQIANLQLTLTQLTPREQILKTRKQIFQINFQFFRLCFIQDRIFSLFQHLYFQQPRVSKFLLYITLKFITIYFLDKLNRLSDRTKVDYNQKYILIKKIIQSKKIEDINKKCNGKINYQLEKEREKMQDQKKEGPLAQYVRNYPEILVQNTSEPRKILFEFCYKKSSEIISNQKFAQMLGMIIKLMQEIQNYTQAKMQINQLDIDIETLSMKKLNKLINRREDIIKKQGLSPIFEGCRIEMSLKSRINQEEIKTDIPIKQR